MAGKMKLKDITEDDITDFADSAVIAGRGFDYYESGMVKSFQVEGDRIIAKVLGSSGKYDPEVWIKDGELDASCNCPYEGYCCKHIAAVLYKWVNEKGKQSNKKTENTKMPDLKKVLSTVEKPKLEEILNQLAEKNEGTKADILASIAKPESNESRAAKSIMQKQIIETLSERGLGYYEVHGVVKELDALKECILKFPAKTRTGLLQEIIEKTIKVGQNSDDSDGDIGTFIQMCIEDLAKALEEQNLPFEEKKKIFLENLDQYEKDDYGFEEGRLELVLHLSKSKEEFEFLIDELKRRSSKKKEKYERGAYDEALTEIYRKSGMEKEYLEMLEKNCKENGEYLPLAKFWKEKGQVSKAIKIAEEGIKKDRADWSDNAGYDFLEAVYASQKNKNDLLRIMILHFEQSPSLTKYKEILALSKHSNIDKIKADLIAKASDNELIDILLYEDMLEKAFDEAMKLDGAYSDRTKDKVAKVLIKKYPEKSLKLYKSIVSEFIGMAERDSYRTAAIYAKKLKELLRNENKINEWEKYIAGVRDANRRRPALMQEFQRL
ncbi:MAG: SWIM zinc finger family protein [Candidatus ainarchaeum sp.]|nr:SWIM zinc finger family protein [Candidatus ainarchaeum sp.]